MRLLLIALLFMALVYGCQQANNDRPADGQATTNDDAQKMENTEPDNTERNVRDRNEDVSITPLDQAENDSDRTITQQIRRALTSDDQLSMTAKNIKIVTMDGVATLRGPVESDQEKSAILARARSVTGLKNINDQLEVKTTAQRDND